MRLHLLTALLLLVLTTDARACFSPPPEQRVPPEELVARSTNIVLAEVTEAVLIRPYEVLYTFRRIKTLSGPTEGAITLLGRSDSPEDDDNIFVHHTYPEFWSGLGRTPNDTDCKIHPTFEIGGTYLLFLDEPYHRKSFERIIRFEDDEQTRDKWLQFVESHVKS